MSCPQCFSGHVNPGKAIGRWDTVYGLRTYISEPPSGKPAQGTIVIIPDAFGVDFVNNQILADHYAAGGQYLVYLPDFMNGTAAPVRCMTNMAYLWGDAHWIYSPYYLVAMMADFIPFAIKNRFSQRWPTIQGFLASLRKDKGDSPIGIGAFCWGGMYGVTLTHDRPDNKTASGQRLVDAVFVAHPSNLSVPDSFEKVISNLAVAIGDSDDVMAFKDVQAAQKILEKKTDVDTEVVVYPGAKHGFSIRASRAKPDSKETKQAEEAEEQALAWFKKQFAKVGGGASKN